MKCHAESFFQNCSLIAPSRLSESVFIYCSIAPSWFTPLHTFPLSIFLACFLQTQIRSISLWNLNHLYFWRVLFVCPHKQCVLAACSLPLGVPATGLRAMVGAGVRPQMLQQFRGTAEHLTAKICNMVTDNRCNFIVFLKLSYIFLMFRGFLNI